MVTSYGGLTTLIGVTVAVVVFVSGCQTERFGAETTPSSIPAPVPVPGGTSSCPLPAYPKPSCTGVPAGTRLTSLPLNYDGTIYRVTGDNQVLDSVHIAGNVLVTGHNTTIKNSQIDGHILNEYSGVTYPMTITDSTIGPASGCGGPVIAPAEYTAIRVHVRNASDGFRDSGNNILVQDSYVHLCSSSPEDHSDGFQGYLGGTNVKIYHNTIDQRDVPPEAQTAPIFIANESKDADIQNNLLAGGSATIRVHNGGGSYIVTGNRIVDNSWVYGPVSSSCDVITWSDNWLVDIDDDYNITSMVAPQPCLKD